jgi:membrane-bound metal-dependent hydrolase YbcI (DUF457 family)
MSRFRTHAVFGVAAGAGAYALRFSAEKRRNPKEKIDLKELLLYAGIGSLASCLPDLLEPPSDPNHRKFFHSIAFAGLGCLLLQKVQGGGLDEDSKAILGTSWLSYLSHLVADLTTSRGLPLVG